MSGSVLGTKGFAAAGNGNRVPVPDVAAGLQLTKDMRGATYDVA